MGLFGLMKSPLLYENARRLWWKAERHQMAPGRSAHQCWLGEIESLHCGPVAESQSRPLFWVFKDSLLIELRYLAWTFERYLCSTTKHRTVFVAWFDDRCGCGVILVSLALCVQPATARVQRHRGHSRVDWIHSQSSNSEVIFCLFAINRPATMR